MIQSVVLTDCDQIEPVKCKQTDYSLNIHGHVCIGS